METENGILFLDFFPFVMPLAETGHTTFVHVILTYTVQLCPRCQTQNGLHQRYVIGSANSR